jgi:hypothetical protein
MDKSHLSCSSESLGVHIPQHLQSKFSSKSLPCLYLGHAKNKKAFVLYHVELRRIIKLHDVDFDEGKGVADHVTIDVTEYGTDKGQEEIVSDPASGGKNSWASLNLNLEPNSTVPAPPDTTLPI